MSDWRPHSGPLAAEQLGDRQAPRITFMHGFAQTGNSWKPIAEHFALRGVPFQMVASGPVIDGVNPPAGAIAPLATVGGTGAFVGYSLGGRASLHLALMYPHLVTSLVVIGANPGIDDAGERAERREADDALAERMHDIGLEAFLQEWCNLPLFGGLQLTPEQLADRLRNTPEGLAGSLRLAGTGAQGSLWPRLRELNMPVLAIAGALDLKFAAIAQQIADAAPEGAAALVAGAAHAAHLQQPETVAVLIADAIA